MSNDIENTSNEQGSAASLRLPYLNTEGDCTLTGTPCTWSAECDSCPETEGVRLVEEEERIFESGSEGCKHDCDCGECPNVTSCGG